jgi:hypothetical protein
MPYGLGYAVHAVDVLLAELAAVRVDGQAAVDLDAAVPDEVLGLAAAAEAQLFELCQENGVKWSYRIAVCTSAGPSPDIGHSRRPTTPVSGRPVMASR